SGKKVWQVQEHLEGGSFVVNVAFSPDGHTLADTSGDNAIRLRKTMNGQLMAELPAPKEEYGHAPHLVYSPNGRTLASTHLLRVRLWEAATNGLRLEIKHLSPLVNPLAVSPNSRLLATGAEDVRLWDVATGKEVHRFTGHRGAVNEVIFTPDGRHVLSCSNDA